MTSLTVLETYFKNKSFVWQKTLVNNERCWASPRFKVISFQIALSKQFDDEGINCDACSSIRPETWWPKLFHITEVWCSLYCINTSIYKYQVSKLRKKYFLRALWCIWFKEYLNITVVLVVAEFISLFLINWLVREGSVFFLSKSLFVVVF